jgi:peptidoglycan/xylan/chitin deacetylase (PgdA/CDA1 family)
MAEMQAQDGRMTKLCGQHPPTTPPLPLPPKRMAGFRASFISGLKGVASALPLPLLRAAAGQRLVMPVYHLVADVHVPHVSPLYPVRGTRAFIDDLDFLLRHYRPIGLPQLMAAAKGEGTLPRNAFFLSFDDGLSEFHDIIAPILMQKGVPATCFLNSSFIDNKDLFFRYKAALAVDAIATNRTLLHEQAVKHWFAAHTTTTDPKEALLRIHYPDRHLLDELLPLLGIDAAGYLAEMQPYLTTTQVSALMEQGFHFGAHSCDHPEYALIPQAEQVRQTVESLDLIVQHFQLPYRAFAFPFTDFGADEAVLSALHGPDPKADISFGCAGMKRDRWPRHFQRIAIEQEGLSAQQTIHSEYLYYLLKAPLGRNITRRK